MIKNILFGLILFFSSTPGYSQESASIHEQVFGSKIQEHVIEVPLIYQSIPWGEVKIKVFGDEIQAIERDSVLRVLENKIINEKLSSIRNQVNWITLENTGLNFIYEPSTMVLVLKASVDNLVPSEREIVRHNEFREQAIAPANFSGAISARSEQFLGAESLGGNYFQTHLDSFVNYKGYVLENQSLYQTINDRVSRGDTRLIKDFQQDMVRAQLGDVNYQTIGYQTMRPVGGVSVAKNFSLNPYRSPYPRFEESFQIHTRSTVNYYVNGNLIKAESLLPGRYSVRDLPLTNGLNTIVVEVTDEQGRREVYNFKQSTSINQLNAQEFRFDISSGKPFLDDQYQREYSDDMFTSGFLQYGFNKHFTTAVYSQQQKDFILMGSESIFASAIGSFSFSGAFGKNEKTEGSVLGVGYQLALSGLKWFEAHYLNLKYEQRFNEFVQSVNQDPSLIKNLVSLSYGLPLFKALTFNIGGQYGSKSDNALVDRYGIDSSINIRINNQINASVYASRFRTEYDQINDMAYVMINISFPEKQNYLTAYADLKNKTQRLTHIKDNQNQLNTFRTQTSIENNESSYRGDTNVTYTTSLADMGVSALAVNDKHGFTEGRVSLRLQTGIVFAGHDEHSSWAVTRPVHTSFAIFEGNDFIETQKFSIKANSPYAEGNSDFLGRSVFINLLPYQYREIYLDPSELEEGYSLGKEYYVLFPSYRSGHLVKVGAPGAVALRGHLHLNGEIAPLKTGYIENEKGDKTLFFTNREGGFFLESLTPGKFLMKIEGHQDIEFDIPEGSRGLINIDRLESVE